MPPTVAFAVEDVPSYKALAPVAEALDPDVDVEFLFVDALFASKADGDTKRIPENVKSRHPHREFTDYVRVDHPFLTGFPDGTLAAIVQKGILDGVSYRPGYDVRGYLADADPDAVVCAMDSLPFVRHVIAEAAGTDVTTVAVQHGMYPKNLSPEKLGTRYGALSPSFPEGDLGAVETLKRRFGYRYGVTVYCHPHVDYVCTLGSFFTERIRALRDGYPCTGHTDLVATGSPEYSGPVREYSPGTDSLLFLSQQQYEGGHWSEAQLETVIEFLNRLDEQVPVTVRPHPKDSAEKRAHYGEHFPVSEEPDLARDVAGHDAVLTSHSTALFEGIIQGKVCAVFDFPWRNEIEHPDFPPFRHEHLLRVRDGSLDVAAEARERSPATQRDFLDRFCHMPGENEGEADSSTERIAALLREAASGGDAPAEHAVSHGRSR